LPGPYRCVYRKSAGFERRHHPLHRLGKHQPDQLPDYRVLKLKIDNEINYTATFRKGLKLPVIGQMPEWAIGLGNVYFHGGPVEHNAAGIGSPERLVANDQIGKHDLAPVGLQLSAVYARAAAPGQKFGIAGNVRHEVKHLSGAEGRRVFLFMPRHA
jgi:hypothetical protein